MLARLCLFWRLQGTLSFLVFSGFQRLPAFLGLWSLPPSKPAVTSQVSLPLHPSDCCLHHHISFLTLNLLLPSFTSRVLVPHLCLTLCDPMGCSLPGSSVHGVLQARIPEWVAMPSSRESSWPRDWTRISCGSWITGSFCITELPGLPSVFTRQQSLYLGHIPPNAVNFLNPSG